MAGKVAGFKPFLTYAKTLKPEDIDFSGPLLASFKMDGIRCLISPTPAEHINELLVQGDNGGWLTRQGNLQDGAVFGPWETTPLTRSLKPVRNAFINHHLSMLPAGLDGEIGLVNPDTGAVDFRATTSGVMNGKGEPDFRFYVFDDFLHDGPLHERLKSLEAYTDCDELDLPDWVVPAEQTLVSHPDDVREMYERALELGHEGLILRCPESPYKAGRGTPKDRVAFKMKPWEDSEGVIVDIEVEYENTNALERDERGYAKRSKTKDGRAARQRVGKLILRDDARFPGQEIAVGTGMTHAEKEAFFNDPPIGQLAKYKFVVAGGYDAPRHASFQGIRHPEDMS